MCGINGILLSGRYAEPKAADGCASVGLEAPLHRQIEGMNAAIAHRGPDGDGIFLAPNIALGHRRLAILDLSSAGAQPMHSGDRTLTLVFNGEIYNYLELADELKAKGCIFRSHTDSEVILHAYAAWGPGCVQRFNGMWAFAIWDEKNKILFASRDRLGVKPFFYVKEAERFFFSSEIAGIRSVKSMREANLGKLHDYLAYGYRTNNGETFFKNIMELRPAHNLMWRDGNLTINRYWDLPTEKTTIPAAQRADAYAALLRDAVRLRFRSDVPVALLQSGGIDSSVIGTVVNDEIEAGRLGYKSVSAFTATHPGHAFDESRAVRELMVGCPHIRSVELTTSGDALAEEFGDYVAAMQEPMGSAASYSHWTLMRAVRREGIKVVINGQGADEALAGYGHYLRGYRLLDLAMTRPWQVPAEAAAMHNVMGSSYASLAAQTCKAIGGRRLAARWRANFVEDSVAVLNPSFRSANADYLPDLGMVFGGGNLDRHLRGQLQDYGFNQILHYEDQSSMSQGIEIRSPFVDYRLIEFAFKLPSADKFSGGITKRILRSGFDRRVPSSIIHSNTKLGFSTPFNDWMARPALQAFVQRTVASAAFKECSLWDAGRLAKVLQDPQALRSGFPAWRYLMVCLWLGQNGIQNG